MSERCATQAPFVEPHLHPFPHPHHTDPEYDDAIATRERGLFWIVCAISNPVRFKTRYALYRKFKHHVLHELHANLVTVECAEGMRDFQVTGSLHASDTADPPDGVQHIEVQLRRMSITWNKEEMMNVGIGRLPLDAKYVMCCDSDITFYNKAIVTETIHALQLHRVVQPFESCADLGPDGQVMQIHKSFGWCHARGLEWHPRGSGTNSHTQSSAHTQATYTYDYDDCAGRHMKSGNQTGMGNMGILWHPGYCMAFRKGILDKMGGLLDVGILGASDHHMFGALIGKAKLTYPPAVHKNYKKAVHAWEARADKVIKRDVGYVPGTILHSFHGSKKTRFYASRWDILIENDFDPETDTRRTPAGVRELVSTKIGLRDGIRRYFKSRSEDDLGMD